MVTLVDMSVELFTMTFGFFVLTSIPIALELFANQVLQSCTSLHDIYVGGES